ncbi:Fe(2+) transporter permease subunit FeoB [Legionella micdadei]|uniref:Ferrous iron transport protein B n=1 Tax=Legionella micdadei TaxID=451 RepID=A0A098GCD3_LEGMI|nr:Fe(2+) transporter permease subunit FeoB [Legionella micdadei]ARG96428.1 ferrous iron transporter B [Legionella micdadei]ARG99177.1 ferrous iron transporter B [Legionella micdadei]KTD29481.1 ferrous iron transport protein B [Legionella micdadei]NSL18121.1 Fe(2+) transporter permease subunit FeoB [Legionella micdadei]CEG59637.1 Ferrous iron transport protein B [Legionella micdadei]
MTQLLLVGNPNCGKTTLFNALTGSNQRVGNWPGVTVEKKTGSFSLEGQTIQVTDLPGIYSLASSGQSSSLDEQIAAKAIISLDADLIVNVVDACHLERHLYLTSQLLELGKPVIILLNMMDIAGQRGIKIDTKRLSTELNTPVLGIQAHKQVGFAELRQKILNPVQGAKPLNLNLPASIKKSITHLEQQLLAQNIDSHYTSYYARRIIEGDRELLNELLGNNDKIEIDENDLDIILADARYQKIHQIVKNVQQKQSDASEHFTAKLDRIVLHRYWAFPIFFAMMYLMFLFAINIGGAFQDFFDISTDAIFVQGSAKLLAYFQTPDWLIALIANGVGKGINTTLTFIPVIASMFFFLSLLEASGYMARAAFVVDKAMRAMGLPGKSFVPMIVGFGCNVPAIMAARTLDSERDRLLTVLMSPFMSCSARLAIYAVFVAAFFPTGGQNIVFSLYLIGILMAVLTGFVLRKTSLRGQASPLILELPAYHRPALKRLVKETALRLRHFVFRAGRLIIPICVILGGLNALTVDGGVSASEANSHSLLSLLGQWLTPIFAPMGLHQDNWPATVGLLTGMLAKEVVVGSLNSLYAQIGHVGQGTMAHFDFWGSLQAALWSIPQNLAQLGEALVNPIIASAPDSELSQSVYGMMVQRFDGKVGAYAYLLFVLLYIPCVSTMAVIRQEANRKLMWFSIIWSFIIAYATAVLFYQIATFSAHPQQSITWILVMLFLVGIAFGLLRNRTLDLGGAHAVTNS